MDRLLRIAEVQEITGLSRASVYKMVADGRLPPPVRLSSRCVRWRESELLATIEALPVRRNPASQIPSGPESAQVFLNVQPPSPLLSRESAHSHLVWMRRARQSSRLAPTLGTWWQAWGIISLCTQGSSSKSSEMPPNGLAIAGRPESLLRIACNLRLSPLGGLSAIVA